MEPLIDHDAVVLAGGGGRRLGGIDKAALLVAGRSLLDRTLAAASSAARVVVVSPHPAPPGTLGTIEEPAGGGPVAGLAAGLRTLRTGRSAPPPYTLVLAVDCPNAADVTPRLIAAARDATSAATMNSTGQVAEPDGFCPVTPDGRWQWLLALYRTEALVAALAPYGSGHGVAMRQVVTALTLAPVPVANDLASDIDTWEDHRRWDDTPGVATPRD